MRTYLGVLVCLALLTGSHAPALPGGEGGPGEALAKGKKKKKGDDKILVWLRVGKVVDAGVLVTVQWGQRLQDIAETYGTSISAIKKANPGLNPSAIMVGEKILVPGATKVLAVKTWVPADKIDEIPGMQDLAEDVSGKKGKKKKHKKKHKGKVMVKSGKVAKHGVWHTIQPGQILSDVASAYGVSAHDIAKATPLDDPDTLQVGQKVLVPGATEVVAVPADPGPGEEIVDDDEHKVKSGKKVKAGVLHIVQPGQVLHVISSAYGVSVKDIVKANKLDNANSIKQGQKILIPGASKVVAVKADPDKALAMPTEITFHRIHTGETRTIMLYNSKGKLVPSEYKKFEKMMFDHRTGKTHKIHPLLCYKLKLVAQKFPGKVLTIYSGYRAYDPEQYTKKSKHNYGRAIDFAVNGVSNVKLMKFCKTLKNVGVGYYPNSYFIHLDVRDTSTFWVDYSHPGQAPKYKKWKKHKKKKHKKAKDPGVNIEADSDAAEVDVK
jgi:LysM repeat protein